MDGAVTEHYHFILFKIWGWNGQKLRFCVDGSPKRRTKRGLQKHPDTSGWGLNRKAGREIIAPSVPSFPYFSSNDFCRPLSPSDGRFPPCVCLHVCSWRGAYGAPQWPWVDHYVTVKMVPGWNGCSSYLFRGRSTSFQLVCLRSAPIQGACCPADGVSSPLHRRWRTGSHCRDKLQVPWGAARNPPRKTSSELDHCRLCADFFPGIFGHLRALEMPAIG